MNIKFTCAIAAAAALSGCASVGPDYAQPSYSAPQKWHVSLDENEPGSVDKNWWMTFGDKNLLELMELAQKNNPTLDKALAAIEMAKAGAIRAGARGLPDISARHSNIESKSLQLGKQITSTSKTNALDASWEIDLFGSVRRASESGAARVESAKAGYEDALISLKAQVASEYVTYKSCIVAKNIYERTLESSKKTLQSTRDAMEQGALAKTDEQLAIASMQSMKSALVAQGAECEAGIKNMTLLTSADEQIVVKILNATPVGLPSPAKVSVQSLPAQLLTQRPDIVSAERNVASASAEIGFAQAAQYPRLTLNGSISSLTYSSGSSSIEAKPWSFGPSLTMPLFDAGATRAQIEQAKAAFTSAQATYKMTVLGAIRDVEQALVRLKASKSRIASAQESAKAYQYHLEASNSLWQVGQITTLTLEQSRRNALQAEQTELSARRDQLLYAIALYKAIGGGWSVDEGQK